MPKFFDIHSHIQDSAFDADILEVIQRMQEADVWTIMVGTDRRSSQLAAQICSFYYGIYSSIGIHPTDGKHKFNTPYFRDLLECKKVVAIGECGLDYLRIETNDEKEKQRQKDLFVEQLEFAVKYGKPLMIHCREAHEDMIEILKVKKEEYGDKLWGNIHFFTSTWEVAQKYIELGFTLSFSGVITFASDYDEVVKNAPIDMIMSETDTPYATPVPHRGKRNEPVYVEEVVKKIAELREEPLEEVAETLVNNAKRVFRIEG